MESIKLNLIPSDNTKPVCHASQYDIGRSIRLELYDGDFPYILSDETIELDVKKGDGNVITTDLTFEEGDAYVDMITTEQMTAIAGQNFCELKISKDAAVIYTKNFILKVEQSVLEGGIQSESEINNLETQIAGLVEDAVENQYDSENVIFDSEPTAGHGTGYTVTSSGLKTALDAKAEIDDTTPSTAKVWSSKKTSDTIADQIDDTTTSSTAKTWSAKKTNDTINGLIDDTATSTAKVWSAKKTGDTISGLIDDTEASTEKVWSSKKTSDSLAALIDDANSSVTKTYSSKKIDGLFEEEHDQLTAGLAKQIKSSVGNEDKTPYLFRTAGGSIDIGDREEDTIIGATMAWNQLVQNGNFEDNTKWNARDGAVFTISNNICSVTFSTQSISAIKNSINLIQNHVYFLKATVKGSDGKNISLSLTNNGGSIILPKIEFVPTPSWSEVTALGMLTATTGDSAGDCIMFRNRSQEENTIDIKEVIAIDLTQMFGSTIADYIASLENSTAGAGVAWLKNHGFMTKPYYPYNAGELISVKTKKHITRGFNQFDGQTEQGSINASGQETESTARCRAKNYMRVVPNTAYFFTCQNTDINILFVNCYDINKTWKSQAPLTSQASAFTIPNDIYYIRVTFCKTDTVTSITPSEITKANINVRWDGERDREYEPYVEHEYPLDGTKEWRGLFKLDANNKLYADGDRYPSDGQAERRFAIVDLGSLNWSAFISPSKMVYLNYPQAKTPANSSTKANIICDSYATVSRSEVGYSEPYTVVGIGIDTLGNLFVTNPYSNWASKEDAKADLSGVYMAYEKATPTAETAAAYTNPQLVDDFGTEEYEDTRDIPVPVGHETMYQANLRAKLEMAPESPSGNGDYLVRQTDGQNEYVAFTKELPVAPTTDGNYRLKLTVSGGTPSLSWEAIT